MRLNNRSLLLLAPVLGSVVVFAQTAQKPVFRTGVQLVRIDVSVLDTQRHPVRGLQASDFTVLDNDQPRPIRAFTAIDVTTPASSVPPLSPSFASDPVTNRAIGDDTSRLLFILMDRSIATDRPMIVARQIAKAAVDAMSPGDLAAIVTTGGGVPQNLTSDRARLHKAIETSDWSQGLSHEQMDDPILTQLQMNDSLSDGRCLCGLCVMDTITRIANNVRDVPRRKILLFIGSNLIVQAGPRAMNADVGCDKRVRDSRERLFDALGTSGLTVHSIDPGGLSNVGPQSRASAVNGQPNVGPIERLNMLTQERTDAMVAQGNLDVLPSLTGGRTILNSNEPFQMVPAVLHESDAYYLLAFEPAEGAGPARHNIRVEVARKGVDVHTARFVSPAAASATPAAASSALDEALTNLLPNPALPLQMGVATFAGADRDHAYVGVTVDASVLATSGSVPLQVALLASDARGQRVGGASQKVMVEVPPAAAGDAAHRPVEVQTYLTLPPGDYELRAAVANGSTQAAGSVFTHITVPAFGGGKLSVSDLVLGTRTDTRSLPDAAPALPIVPTTARAFGIDARLWAFLRVYRGSDTGPVTVDSTVLDGNGKSIDQRSKQLDDAAFHAGGADVRLDVPLLDLDPGSYVLRVDVKHGADTISRSVAFKVRS